MPFVTRLRLTSGDRAALESVVADVREAAGRKGAELKGPHSPPPSEFRVPLFRSPSDPRGRVGTWRYAVYARELEIVGHEEFAAEVARREVPDAVHVAVEVEHVRSTG